jgi:hypothetical protein
LGPRFSIHLQGRRFRRKTDAEEKEGREEKEVSNVKSEQFSKVSAPVVAETF